MAKPRGLFLNSFIGTQPHSFVYTLTLAAFVLQWQNSVTATENIQPAKLKVLSGSFQKKHFADLWSRTVVLSSTLESPGELNKIQIAGFHP